MLEEYARSPTPHCHLTAQDSTAQEQEQEQDSTTGRT